MPTPPGFRGGAETRTRGRVRSPLNCIDTAKKVPKSRYRMRPASIRLSARLPGWEFDAALGLSIRPRRSHIPASEPLRASVSRAVGELREAL